MNKSLIKLKQLEMNHLNQSEFADVIDANFTPHAPQAMAQHRLQKIKVASLFSQDINAEPLGKDFPKHHNDIPDVDFVARNTSKCKKAPGICTREPKTAASITQQILSPLQTQQTSGRPYFFQQLRQSDEENSQLAVCTCSVGESSESGPAAIRIAEATTPSFAIRQDDTKSFKSVSTAIKQKCENQDGLEDSEDCDSAKSAPIEENMDEHQLEFLPQPTRKHASGKIDGIALLSGKSSESHQQDREEESTMSARQQKRMKLGRSPVNFEDYMRESEQQVKDWRAEMEQVMQSADPLKSQIRNKLRNKISALTHRMRVKKAKHESDSCMEQKESNVTQFAAIIEEELSSGPQGRKFYKKIQAKVARLMG